MEFEGIDRIVIGVRDLDKGMSFFSNLLGVSFEEVKGEAPEAAGVRFAMNLDKHLELISPVRPNDMNPPDSRTLAKWLDERGDGILYALIFKVKDLDEAVRHAEEQGLSIIGNKVEMESCEPLGITNFKEVVFCEDDTMNLKLAFVQYDED